MAILSYQHTWLSGSARIFWPVSQLWQQQRRGEWANLDIEDLDGVWDGRQWQGVDGVFALIENPYLGPYNGSAHPSTHIDGRKALHLISVAADFDREPSPSVNMQTVCLQAETDRSSLETVVVLCSSDASTMAVACPSVIMQSVIDNAGTHCCTCIMFTEVS